MFDKLRDTFSEALQLALGRHPAQQIPRTYRTKSGKILTDEDIEALADEAERGYDITKLRERNLHRDNQHPGEATPETGPGGRTI